MLASRVASQPRVVKTAISLPRDLHQRAEELRARNGMSRSALYAAALGPWLDAMERSVITEQLDRVYLHVAETPDEKRARRARNRRMAAKHWEW